MANDIKYCVNCAHEMKANDEFCPNCGQKNKVTIENTNDSINLDEQLKENFFYNLKIKLSEKNEGFTNKKTFKKRNIFALIIIIIGGFLLNYTVFKEETKVDMVKELQTAIIEKDNSKLKNLIKSPDNRLKIDDTVINMLLSHYDVKASELDSHMKNLLKGEYKNSPFKFDQEKFLFKKRNVIVLQPRYITIAPYNENIKSGNIKIEIKSGDKVIKTLDNFGEVGPLSTGKYTITSSFESEYAKSTYTIDKDLFESSFNGMDDLKLFNKIKVVNIESNKNDATLYVNGKSTNKKIKDIGTDIILEEGTEIYGILEENKKTIKSDVLTIDESDTEYNLFFEEVISGKTETTTMNSVNSNISENIKSFIYNYERDYQIAINDGDFYYISDYLSYQSEVYYEYKSNIDKFYQNNIKRYLDSYYIDEIINIGNDNYKVIVIEQLNIDNDGNNDSRKDVVTFTIENNSDGNFYITDAKEESF